MPAIHVLPHDRVLRVPENTNLLDALRKEGLSPDAPCGGNGKCGKCTVMVDGVPVPACRTVVTGDIAVTIPHRTERDVPLTEIAVQQNMERPNEGCTVALDLGTTSVVCFLLEEKTGRVLAKSSMQNPQTPWGADVVSRIRAALKGDMEALTRAIREGMTGLIREVCREAGLSPEAVSVVAPVGNPAMQQLFLGILPENLAEVPFAPVLTEAKVLPCGGILPVCPNAPLLVIPDISGYIGADTIGCLLSTEFYKGEEITLLVDIGTNGEMVLGNRHRMVACATAAGPALEGAGIRFGMRAAEGAIDHVWLEDGKILCSVIGGGEAVGICGSGLLDAVAAGLTLGLINKRGRIRNDSRTLPLTDKVCLTQEDIRQVMLAKGAIHAGITLMARHLGLEPDDIQKVLLAGAFGSFLNPESACRIGLLPEQLLGKIEAVGNAAGCGARLLACDRSLLPLTEELAGKIEFLELASLDGFPRAFAKSLHFREE